MYYPDFYESFSRLIEDIKADGRPVAVLGHSRPDGDCIGSQVAMARVLRAIGCEAFCVNADALPRRLAYFVGEVPFFKLSDWTPADVQCLYVDCGDQERVGEKMKALFPNPVGNIDHHLDNPQYAKHNLVNPASAATCEILAGLFLDHKLPIDANTAKALYAGIATDTGQFRFNATTRRTFMLAAMLVATGASPSEAASQFYERESLGKLQLLQRFLASFRLECGGRVCVGFLPRGIFQETGTSGEDIEGIVDYTRSIEGVDIGVLIEGRESGIKASLRSKNPIYRVDQIADVFGGGGHACAAGLTVQGTDVEEFYKRLIPVLGKRLVEIDELLKK